MFVIQLNDNLNLVSSFFSAAFPNSFSQNTPQIQQSSAAGKQTEGNLFVYTLCLFTITIRFNWC
jgi:hypothetical protein